jgi:hypothetical protein
LSRLRTQRRRHAALRAVLLGLAMLAFVLPLGWTLLAALGLVADNGRTPPAFVGPLSLDHFLEVGVAEPSFRDELLTSSVAAACATLLATAVSFLFAYGLARSRFRGRYALIQCFLVLASLPAMAYVIPLSDLMRRALLSNSVAGLVLTEATFGDQLEWLDAAEGGAVAPGNPGGHRGLGPAAGLAGASRSTALSAGAPPVEALRTQRCIALGQFGLSLPCTTRQQIASGGHEDEPGAGPQGSPWSQREMVDALIEAYDEGGP